jgi:NTP pyrophosphatase (non-canonical NTP hydrolase)
MDSIHCDNISRDCYVDLHEVHASGDILMRACNNLAENAGWWKDAETGEDVRNWEKKYFMCWVATKLMLTVSEVSEAMEGHRKNLTDDHLPHRRMLEVELADAVIRICDLAGGLKFDLGGAIAEKLAYNAKRPDHKIDHRVAEGGKAY